MPGDVKHFWKKVAPEKWEVDFVLPPASGHERQTDWSKGQVLPKRGSYFIRRRAKMTAGFSPPRMLPIKNHPFG
jgi:hypothetical protein